MDDNGTYLGNIYGIYKECITDILMDIYGYIINIYGYASCIPYIFHKYSIYVS